MILRVLIADDEPLALRRLQVALESLEDVEIVGMATDGALALKRIEAVKPDVVFVDIEMPHLTGMDLAETLSKSAAPAVVFVTAHESFAVQAFDNGAVDYLLKPLDEDRLLIALERVRALLGARSAEERAAQLASAFERLRSGARAVEPEFWVAHRNEFLRVALRDVNWIGVDGDYVILHAATGDYLLHESLRNIERQLISDEFLRVHRNAIVRKSLITSVERLSMGRLQIRLPNDTRVRVSRPYRGLVLSLVQRCEQTGE